MARFKGHKAGCRCVGCSPATRKRGQKALEAWQRENGRGGGTRSNPRGGGKGKGGTRKNPSSGGKGGGKPRSNPTPVRVERETVERYANVPSEVFDAKRGYLVLYGESDRRIKGCKFCGTLKEVREILEPRNKGFAVVADLRAVGRA